MVTKGSTVFVVRHDAVGPVYAMWVKDDEVTLDDLRRWYVSLNVTDKKQQDAEIQRLIEVGAFEERRLFEGEVVQSAEPVAMAPKPDFRRPEDIERDTAQ